jgi:hypothetical protein
MDFREQKNFASNARVDRTSRIRALNDKLRTEHRGGRLFITEGICRLDGLTPVIVAEVAAFTEFTPGNDPHSEHDFGALTVLGSRVLWKIDYYDRTLTAGSPDPADESVTTRVLTIMLASEY